MINFLVMHVVSRALLLRHSQSTWNAEGRWQGLADPPLSPYGEELAGIAAQHLSDFAFGTIYSSTLLRARRTAEIIGDYLGISEIQFEEDLRERDAGDFTGLTNEEIDQRWPEAAEAHRLGLPAQPPNANNEGFAERAHATVKRISSLAGERPVLIVTHGGFIRSLEREVGAVPSPRFPNLSGRWISHVQTAEDSRLVFSESLLIDAIHHDGELASEQNRI